MWKDRPASVRGQYYKVSQAYCDPQPATSIPLLIGGGGEKYMLPLVARYADWWNVNYCHIEDYARKIMFIREYCKQIQRDPTEIRLTYSSGKIMITEQSDRGRLHTKTNSIIGTPIEVTQALDAYRL